MKLTELREAAIRIEVEMNKRKPKRAERGLAKIKSQIKFKK